jgi:hypothetical protein
MKRTVGRIYKVLDEVRTREDANWFVCMGFADEIHGLFVDDYYDDPYECRWENMEEADADDIDESDRKVMFKRVFGDRTGF